MDGCEVKLEHWDINEKFSPRYIDIDVDPCTKYVIKVLASEDYQVVIQQLSQEKKDL